MTDRVLHGYQISCNRKDMAFLLMSYEIARQIKTSKRQILESMQKRESLADTALIDGIALPHVVLKKEFSPQLFIFKSDRYLQDWNCLDQSKVKNMICLVFPEKISSANQNYQVIRKVINRLANEEIDYQISQAKSSTEIIKILRDGR